MGVSYEENRKAKKKRIDDDDDDDDEFLVKKCFSLLWREGREMRKEGRGGGLFKNQIIIFSKGLFERF